jgi:peptidoglycan/xylan/chitin deacetylase (PgdA/CDA1 family)
LRRINRRRIAEGLERTGLLSLVLDVRARTPSPWLPVLTYHRFATPQTAGAYDDAVADASPASFDRQMSLLARWFHVVSLEDVLAFRAGKRLPPNPVMVTFDDGYKDGLEVAVPILRKHGVPATFFVATDYIDQRKLFWWDRVHWVVKSSKKESIELSYPSPHRYMLGSDVERFAAAERLVRLIKDEGGMDLERFLDHVSAACDVSLGTLEERRMADDLLMTWDDLRALRDAGMSVQSHSRSHRTLQTVPLERLGEELGGSRETLEHELGDPVLAISYPVGKRLGRAPAIRAAIRAAGYELGFSNASGVNHVWRFDALDARRLALEADLPDAYFLAMLALPALAY